MTSRRSWAITLVVIPLLVACGAHGSAPDASSGSTPDASSGSLGSTQRGCCAPTNYQVSGQLVTEGGPPGTPSMHWPGTITVRGPVDETVRTDARGRFRLHLPAGTYQVTGRSPRYDGGKATCPASGPLVVRDGPPVWVDVVCQLM